MSAGYLAPLRFERNGASAHDVDRSGERSLWDRSRDAFRALTAGSSSGRTVKLRSRSIAQLLLGIGVALSFTPASARAATLFGIVEQDGFVISDSSGLAQILPGTSATISIFLFQDMDEFASVFEGVFDLTVNGVIATAILAAVEAEWDSVAQNTVGSESIWQSTWSDLSNPVGGQRLVAQWAVDATTATLGDLFRIELGVGTFAGTDLPIEPFFEDIPIQNPIGEVLAAVTVVPEPGSFSLVMLGLIGLGVGRRVGS